MSARHRRQRPSPVRTVLDVVLLGVSWGVFALVAGLGIVTVGLPLATGSVPLTVLTGSMAPALPPGTLVVVGPTAPADVRLGDVLTFQMESGSATLVSHRVVELRSVSDGTFEFVTKGDANGIADPEPVTERQIRGTTWYSVPWVGYLSMAFSGSGRHWLAPLIGSCLIGYAFVQIVLSLRAARRRRLRTALDT